MKSTHEETTMISVQLNKAVLRDEKDVIWYFLSSLKISSRVRSSQESTRPSESLELSANLINTFVASRASIHMTEDNLFKLTWNGADYKKSSKIRIRLPGSGCFSISF